MVRCTTTLSYGTMYHHISGQALPTSLNLWWCLSVQVLLDHVYASTCFLGGRTVLHFVCVEDDLQVDSDAAHVARRRTLGDSLLDAAILHQWLWNAYMSQRISNSDCVGNPANMVWQHIQEPYGQFGPLFGPDLYRRALGIIDVTVAQLRGIAGRYSCNVASPSFRAAGCIASTYRSREWSGANSNPYVDMTSSNPYVDMTWTRSGYFDSS